MKVGEGAWFGERDIAESGVREDKEAGETGLGGLLFAPVAEFVVEGLLRSGEFGGMLRWRCRTRRRANGGASNGSFGERRRLEE